MYNELLNFVFEYACKKTFLSWLFCIWIQIRIGNIYTDPHPDLQTILEPCESGSITLVRIQILIQKWTLPYFLLISKIILKLLYFA